MVGSPPSPPLSAQHQDRRRRIAGGNKASAAKNRQTSCSQVFMTGLPGKHAKTLYVRRIDCRERRPWGFVALRGDKLTSPSNFGTARRPFPTGCQHAKHVRPLGVQGAPQLFASPRVNSWPLFFFAGRRVSWKIAPRFAILAPVSGDATRRDLPLSVRRPTREEPASAALAASTVAVKRRAYS